jgi:hypothetical protein
MDGDMQELLEVVLLHVDLVDVQLAIQLGPLRLIAQRIESLAILEHLRVDLDYAAENVCHGHRR